VELWDKALGAHSVSSSSHPWRDTGCEPFLLFTAAGTAHFDPYATDPATPLYLSGERVADRVVQHQFTQRDRRRGVHSAASDVAEWSEILGDDIRASAFAGAQRFQEIYPQLLSGQPLEYQNLKQFCATLGIPVAHRALDSHARLVLRPRWRREPGGYCVDADSLEALILVNRGLSTEQKTAALAHEIAHFGFHLRQLAFFAWLPIWIAERPERESAACELFTPSWQERFNRTCEIRADLFTSFVVVPDGFAEMVAKLSLTSGVEVSAVAYQYQWLRPLMNDHAPVTWGTVKQWVDDAAAENRRLRSAPYNPGKSLYDRIAWCVFNRSPELWAELDAIEDELAGSLVAFMRSFEDADEPKQIGSDSARRWFRRATLATANDVLTKTPWEPILIEPEQKAEGYTLLAPARRDTYVNWRRLEDSRGTPMTLKQWYRATNSSGKGLILYPSPLVY
jgi:hypothetical protein